MSCAGIAVSTGLSPRARGSLSNADGMFRARGSIPAGAGEPGRRGETRQGAGVYPRGRGGAWTTEPAPGCTMGLSPRARGSRDCGGDIDGFVGSIPAGAGEPTCNRLSGVVTGVYPRGRGGAVEAQAILDHVQGLSPRARGSLAHDPPHERRRGSIPAGAGEPETSFPTATATRVYPRGRGGAFAGQVDAGPQLGLSPRARGSPRSLPSCSRSEGSIPAGAGKPQPRDGQSCL